LKIKCNEFVIQINNHLKILARYPRVQGGKSSDISRVVEEIINKARQYQLGIEAYMKGYKIASFY